MSLSLLAQVVGFLRTFVIAAMFGASLKLDAYYLSLIVPALITGVIGGALQAGFVPVYVRLLSQGTLEQAAFLRGAVLCWLTAMLALISAAAIFTSPIWARWLATNGGTDLQDLTIVAARLTMISALLNTVSDYLALVLNCHRRFALAAAAPIINTLVSVVALLAIGASVEGLAVSLTLGGALQLALIVSALAATRLSMPVRWTTVESDFGEVLRLALPMTIGFAFTQLQLAYLQTLPVGLGEGAVSIFGYATRLQSAVEQVFVIGLGTVLLPHLAERVAHHDKAGVARVMGLIGAILLPAAIVFIGGVWLFGTGTVGVLLARGNFNVATAADVAQVWFYLGFGLFPFAMSTVFSKLIMALGRPRILSVTAAIVLLVSYAMGSILPSIWGLAGVALVFAGVQCLRLIIYGLWLGPYFLAPDRPAPRAMSVS